MSATEAPPSGSSASESAPAPPDPRPARGRAWTWVAVVLASLAAFVVLTWPLALHMDRIWTAYSTPDPGSNPAASYQPDQLLTGDNLQNVFIQSVVVDNLRALRNPYLDLREGAAGPTPLKTTSLDLPWTALLALLWPVTGLQAAYNAGLLLSSVATGVAAFAWLRRHTRWPLLAAAGALAYASTPHRMFQLTGHFNAVMWWAFPAALLAFEVMLERHRAGRPWRWPAAGLAATTLTVAVGGEYHLILYLTGLLSYLVVWTLVASLARRRSVPWAPAAVVMGCVALSVSYVLAAFAYVFRGDVQGSNGSYEPVSRYAPESVRWLVDRSQAVFDGRLVYVGWAVVIAAAIGLAAALIGRADRARPYAVLLVPLLLLTLGPAADVGPFRPYRFFFDHLPFLSFQRVPQRLMVLTSLVLVLLAVCGLDLVGTRLLAGRRRAAVLVAAAVVVAGTLLVLQDYVMARNLVMRDVDANRVVTVLRTDGDEAGPVLGLPVGKQTSPANSVATYVAALSRRQVLNAYNQTPAPWLPERLRRLAPLNKGRADPASLKELRQAGTRQVVVVNQPSVYRPGQWRSVVDQLVASGHFRVVASDGPLALLQLTDQ